MKTTIHNHLRGQNGCLGFYYGLASLLSAYPEGGLPGEFFINGETQSIWIWDSTLNLSSSGSFSSQIASMYPCKS